MTLGYPIGLYALGDDPNIYEYQVIPPYASRVQQPIVDIVVAVELTVATVDAPTLGITKYFATHGFATSSGDTPAHTYVAGRVTLCQVERRILGGTAPYEADPVERGRRKRDPFYFLTSGIAQAGGIVELSNNDGDLDDWPDIYLIDGRRVTVKLGTATRLPSGRHVVDDYDDFGTVFSGWAGPWERGLDVLRISVSGIGSRLSKPVGSSRYLGTGSTQGTEDLTDFNRQEAFGRAYNVEALPIDDTQPIHQLHSNEMEEVFAIRDKGVTLTATGTDYATYQDLRDATADGEATDPDIPAGSYATCLVRGLIKLGADPQGLVTADIWGDVAANRQITQIGFDDGQIFDDGYGWAEQSLTLPVDTIAGVIWRIEADKAGLAVSDINDSSFASYDQLQPAKIGYVVPTGDGRTVLDAEQEIAATDHAFVYPDQYGRRAIRRLTAPEGASPHSIDDLAIFEIEQEPLPYKVPPSKWRAWYRRNWRQQSEDELAGSVSASRRIVSRRYGRLVFDEDEDIADAHPGAQQADAFTFFEDSADATALIERLFAFYALGRAIWRVTCKGQLFRIELGDTVHLTSSRFSKLASGCHCVVLGIVEDPIRNLTTLELFGGE